MVLYAPLALMDDKNGGNRLLPVSAVMILIHFLAY
jgi:hypothetical protein